MKSSRARVVPLPTRRAVWVAVFVAGLGLLPLLDPALAWVWRAALVATALLVAADFVLRPAPTLLDVRRQVPALVHLGRTAVARFHLVNLARAPLVARVRAPWPPQVDATELTATVRLAGGQTIALDSPFVPLRRGRLSLQPYGVALRGPLGLLEHVCLRGHDDVLRVAPGRPAGEVAALLARAAALEEVGARRSPRRGSEWEFESLREYVVGDEPRHLDWKASARRRRPTVRVFRDERNAELILALDCGRLMNTTLDGVRKVDLAMTPLLDVAAVALRRRERVGLLVFDRKVRAWVPPAAGMTALGTLTATLADLGEDDEPTSYLRAVSHLEERQRRRSLVVVFTDFTDEISARDMFASLTALARRHALLFVGVGDPFLARARTEPARDARGVYERAAAARLLAERRRTCQRLERLGIHALDADPQRLAAPLIASYLALRLGSGA